MNIRKLTTYALIASVAVTMLSGCSKDTADTPAESTIESSLTETTESVPETTAKKISDINNFTVQTIEELIKTSKEMMEFMDRQIAEGFDSMIESNDEFANEIEKLSESMGYFSEVSKELASSMDQVDEDIRQLSETVNTQNEGINEVAGVADAIVSNMLEIRREEEESQQISNSLSENINHFKL